MEKSNITDVVNFKCKEKYHYKQCLIFQRCWLFCTSCFVKQTARLYEELQRGALLGLLINSEISYISKEYTYRKYNILLHV